MFLNLVHHRIRNEGEDDRMNNETRRRGATRFGDAEPVGDVRHDRTKDTRNDLVNQLVEERGTDDKEEETGGERGGGFARDHHFVMKERKKS